MKKTLTIILAIFMMATLAISASAASIVYSGSIGEGFSWSLDSDGKFTITGEGEIPIYDEEDIPWNDIDIRTQIKSVEIGEGITNVPYCAFFNCINLESVSLPDSLKEIGINAFNNCDKLEAIEIPNGVEKIYNMAFAFSGLKSLTVPDSVTLIGAGAFEYTKLESVALSNNIDVIAGKLFSYCEELKSVAIPEGVKAINSNAFNNCKALKEITIPDSVELISSQAFFFCESLTQIKLPASLKTIGSNAFYASGLTSLTLPNGLTTLDDEALAGTYVPGTLVIPDSVTSIGKDILSRTDFTELVLGSGMETVNLESINHYISLIIPEEVKAIAGTEEYIYFTGVHYMGERENLTVEDEKLSGSIHCIEYIDAKAPTCVKDGHEAGYYCEVCDAYFLNTGAATGELATGIHIFEEYISDNNATCTEDATKTAYCEYNCGEKDVVTDEGTAFGHSSVIIPAVPSTCTEPGKTEGSYCGTCGDILVRPNVQHVIPHKFEKYEIYKPATCIERAQEISYCEYGCNNYDVRIVEDSFADHIHTDVWENYAKEGHFHRCTVCNEVLDLTPHTYGDEWTYFAGLDLDGELRYEKTRYCTVCNRSETVEISKEEYNAATGNAATGNTDNCDHLCHKDGFMGFIWKIVQFFWKLFKMNPVCECGAAHY